MVQEPERCSCTGLRGLLVLKGYWEQRPRREVPVGEGGCKNKAEKQEKLSFVFDLMRSLIL